MVQLSFIPLRTGLRRAGGLLTEETSNGISFGRFSHGLHLIELCSIPRALDLAAAQWVRVRLAVYARLVAAINAPIAVFMLFLAGPKKAVKP